MVNVPFAISSASCKLWIPPGLGSYYNGYPLPDLWLGASAAQIPNNGAVQSVSDSSGLAHNITQATAGQAPLLAQFGSMVESNQPALLFRSANSQCLAFPTSVKMGDGSPASEGTIVLCVRLIPGGAGCLWSSPSGPAIEANYPNLQSMTVRYSNTFYTFPNAFAINSFGPQVVALRFSSAGVKLYGDTNYTDALSNVLLSGTVSGGTIGGFDTTQLFTDFDFYDFAQFDQALFRCRCAGCHAGDERPRGTQRGEIRTGASFRRFANGRLQQRNRRFPDESKLARSHEETAGGRWAIL